MKFIKIFLTVFFAIAICGTSNAQFFKKLKKKVENAVENTVTNKVANKASKEAGKSMDKILNPKFNKNSPVPLGGERGNMEDVPGTYNFEWVYRLKMETPKAKEALEVEYYLKKEAPYWGAKFFNKQMQQGMNMFMVYDGENNFSVMFMDTGETKMASVTKITDVILDAAEDEANTVDDYTMSKIDDKVILGKECKGFKMENDQHVFKMYVTFDTEISLSSIYGESENFPKGFNPDWLKEGETEGLMMEMDMKDKTSEKNDMKMTCVKLEKEPFSISKADYQSF